MTDPRDSFDHQAEQAVLGASMQSAEVDDEIVTIVDEHSFSNPVHRMIWRAIRHLRSKNEPTDPLTVSYRLVDTEEIGRIPGGVAYLHTCLEVCPTPLSGPHFARKVRNKAQRRQISMLATQLTSISDIDDPDQRNPRVREVLEHLGNGAISDPNGPDIPEMPHTWSPIDLEPYLSGDIEPILPTIGQRSDGQALMYAGRIHTWAGESEAGKGWLACIITVTEMNSGRNAVIVDFEDEANSWAARLLAAGATPDQLRNQFAYIRPEEPIGSHESMARGILGQALGDLQPSFVLLDGTTDAMTLHGLDPLNNSDASKYGRMLPRWIASKGPAVVASDHLPKSTDRSNGQPRYAIGAVHKLNGVSGAAFILDNRSPFGIGLTGRSTLYIAKDRPGSLRQHGRPSHGLHWFADLVMESHDMAFVDLSLEPPPEPQERARWRPTRLMQRISDAMVGAQEELNATAIRNRVEGRNTDVNRALAVLVDEGYVAATKQGRSTIYTLTRPFVESADDSEGDGDDDVS